MPQPEPTRLFTAPIPPPPKTVDLLLRQTHVAAGGSLTARVSRAEASALLASAGALMPGVARLEVEHCQGGFLLTARPGFDRLQGLTSLRQDILQTVLQGWTGPLASADPQCAAAYHHARPSPQTLPPTACPASSCQARLCASSPRAPRCASWRRS